MPNHCRMKRMRSIVSTGNGGRPRRPAGACGVTNATSVAQGTTRFISSRNSRLRVRLVERFNPRSACFIDQIVARRSASCNRESGRFVQTNPNEVVGGNGLLHRDETNACTNTGCQGVHQRIDAKEEVTWPVAICSSKRKALNKASRLSALAGLFERLKARVKYKVEHPFPVFRRQFGPNKVRYQGLKKGTAQITTLFALANLWMARRELMGVGA